MASNTRLPMAAGATALVAGAAMIAGAILAGAIAGPVTDLPGRWAGFGSIKMSSGETEQMRCVATYFVEGSGVKQNLRCASAGYKIDATANLKIANDVVSGDWEEKIWSTTGSISGRMLSNGFNLTISGPGFTAGLALSTTNCKQSIKIMPRGYEISNISMALDKC